MASASAERYARAAFELATESGRIEAWSDSLGRIRTMLGDADVRRLLDSPTIPSVERVGLVTELVGKGQEMEAVNLVRILTEARRLDLLDGIHMEFERLADETAGRVRGKVTTAVEMSDGDRDVLAAELSSQLGTQVRLDVEVEPSIIGGLVLQVGDRVIDASVRSRLEQLRRRLAG